MLLDEANKGENPSNEAELIKSFNNTSSDEIQHLSTTFASGNRGYGCMFDVSNTEGDYAVMTTIDFHTDLIDEMINVVVYTKEGSYLRSEFKPNDWVVISNTTVSGQGYYKRTPIPMDEYRQVSILNGATQGFYISIDKPNLLYSNVEEGVKIGDVLYQQDGIKFHVGSGLQGSFSDVYHPRLFNGGIHFYHKSSVNTVDSTSMEPTTTSSTGKEKHHYQTALSGDSASFGMMFSLRNKHSYPIYVTSFAFHTDIEGECAVEVYTIPGDYSSKEQSSSEWTKICTASVLGQGENRWSEIPASKITEQVEILAGAEQGFYITLEQPNLKYSMPGIDLELESMGDNYIEIDKGSSVAGYPFGLNISPREPVLKVDYEVD